MSATDVTSPPRTSSSASEVIALWRAALAMGDNQARYAIGYTLLDLGRFDEAKAELGAFCTPDCDNAWAWTYLGMACEGLKDWAGAERAYLEAVRLESAAKRFKTNAPELLHEVQRRRATSPAL